MDLHAGRNTPWRNLLMLFFFFLNCFTLRALSRGLSVCTPCFERGAGLLPFSSAPRSGWSCHGELHGGCTGVCQCSAPGRCACAARTWVMQQGWSACHLAGVTGRWLWAGAPASAQKDVVCTGTGFVSQRRRGVLPGAQKCEKMEATEKHSRSVWHACFYALHEVRTGVPCRLKPLCACLPQQPYFCFRTASGLVSW